MSATDDQEDISPRVHVRVHYYQMALGDWLLIFLIPITIILLLITGLWKDWRIYAAGSMPLIWGWLRSYDSRRFLITMIILVAFASIVVPMVLGR